MHPDRSHQLNGRAIGRENASSLNAVCHHFHEDVPILKLMRVAVETAATGFIGIHRA